MKQHHPTAAQLAAIAKTLPKPKVRPRLADEGGFYCYGSGMNIAGDTIRQAYLRWMAMVWRRVVLGVINTRRVKPL